jgi:hypothetical protein
MSQKYQGKITRRAICLSLSVFVLLRAGLFDDRHANEMLASSNNNKALLSPSVFLPRIAALFRVVATLAADQIIRIKDWHLGVGVRGSSNLQDISVWLRQ